MQPIISPIDHESRHNSYRAEDQRRRSPEQGSTEETPLLHRFPQVNRIEINPITKAVVSLLLIILISGVIIGIYLLILQNDSENILPPVDTPLQILSRSQWDRTANLYNPSSFKARQVIVVQTDTHRCYTVDNCTTLLRSMQALRGESLPYNFLLSSNGQIYEAVGWHAPSPLFSEYSTALVLAFIGNYTEDSPNSVQIQQTQNFFAESISRQHLEPSFTVIAKKTKEYPKYLILSLENLPQWDNALSDS
ncbi:peptidoglycan recognition protein [Aphomia sociella]